MTPDQPGTSFFYSAWPTVLLVVAFGLSFGAALVGLVREWWKRRQEALNDSHLFIGVTDK